MKQWTNTIAASVLLLFSITLYFLIPYQVDLIETEKLHMAPSFYPQLVIISLAAVSLLYLVVSIIQEKQKQPEIAEEKTEKSDRSMDGDVAAEEREGFFTKTGTRARITIVILLVYVYLFEIMGFFVATPLLLAAMMAHMGNRRIVPFFLVIILTPIIMYIVFEKIMVIILPKGIFF